jgi:hypothetical protein
MIHFDDWEMIGQNLSGAMGAAFPPMMVPPLLRHDVAVCHAQRDLAMSKRFPFSLKAVRRNVDPSSYER